VFFPIGDAPNPRDFRAWVTWAIIVANVVVYVLLTLPLSTQAASPQDPRIPEYLEMLRHAGLDRPALAQAMGQLSVYDLFVFQHGFRPAAPSIADLFSSLFLHAGFLHLAGNMFFLWIYGDNVEHRVGRIAYALLYLLTGVVATLGFAVIDLTSQMPLVGASGAISGVLGAYLLLYPRVRVHTLIILPIYITTVAIPAWVMLGYWALLQLIGGLGSLTQLEQGGVAFFAHVGGFVAGLLLVRLFASEDVLRRRPTQPAPYYRYRTY